MLCQCLDDVFVLDIQIPNFDGPICGSTDNQVEIEDSFEEQTANLPLMRLFVHVFLCEPFGLIVLTVSQFLEIAL